MFSNISFRKRYPGEKPASQWVYNITWSLDRARFPTRDQITISGSHRCRHLWHAPRVRLLGRETSFSSLHGAPSDLSMRLIPPFSLERDPGVSMKGCARHGFFLSSTSFSLALASVDSKRFKNHKFHEQISGLGPKNIFPCMLVVFLAQTA